MARSLFIVLAVLLSWPFGSVAAPPSAATSAPAGETIPARGPVEVKWGGLWRKATIVRREGDIYLVNYGQSQDEWVTAERIRPIGSTRDIPYARPTPHGQKPKPSAKATDAPAKSGAATGDTRSAASPTAAEEPALTAPDRRSEKRIDKVTDASWKYMPAPAAAGPRLAANSIAIVGGTGHFFEKSENVLWAPSGMAMITHITAPPGEPPRVRAERLDLKSGKSLGAFELPAGAAPFALSPDATRLITRSEGSQIGTHDRLDLWALDRPKPELLVSFKPYASEDWSKRDVTHAAFIDATHLLTQGGAQEITCWQLPEVKAVYTIVADLASPLTVSDDRRTMIVSAGHRLRFLDTLTGNVLGQLPSDALPLADYRFSPDGRRLCAVSGARIWVWDLATPSVVLDAGLPLVVSGTGVWVDNNFVLVGGRHLVDAKTGVVVWDYTRGDPNSPHFVLGARFYYLWTNRTPRAGRLERRMELISTALPTPQARQAAAKVDLARAFAVRRGAEVTVEVQLAEPGAAAAVLKGLTETLTKNGLKVVDQSPIHVIAASRTGKTHEVSYTFFGRRDPEKISVVDEILSITFVVDGKEAWSATTTAGAPTMISLKQDETLEQVIARQRSNNWRFFTSTSLPKNIPAAREPAALGTSSLEPGR